MSDDAKIFVDEDWKAQVQREREAAAKAPEEAPAEEAAEGEIPEQASFLGLVGSLATQAMFALGLIAPQGQQQVMVDLDQAQYMLEMLNILLEKTAGNLNPEEDASLKQALAELGEVYVARVQQFQQQTIAQGGPPDLKLL